LSTMLVLSKPLLTLVSAIGYASSAAMRAVSDSINVCCSCIALVKLNYCGTIK
jgi:hypothetical protein